MSGWDSRLPQVEDPLFYEGLGYAVRALCVHLYKPTHERTAYVNLPNWQPRSLVPTTELVHREDEGGRRHLRLSAVPLLAFYARGQWLYSTDNRDRKIAGPRTLKSGASYGNGLIFETVGGKKFANGDFGDEKYCFEYRTRDRTTMKVHTYRLKQLAVDFFRKDESSSSFVEFDLDHTILADTDEGPDGEAELYRITSVEEESLYRPAEIGPSAVAADRNLESEQFHHHGFRHGAVASAVVASEHPDPFFPEERRASTKPGPQTAAPPALPAPSHPPSVNFPPRISIRSLLQ